MNTQGNLGGAASSVGIGYIASIWGWNWPFVVSSALALLAALLVSRIDPAKSIAD
jgi:sugar phosphate permease